MFSTVTPVPSFESLKKIKKDCYFLLVELVCKMFRKINKYKTDFHKTEWFGLEETIKTIYFQTPAMGRNTFH